MVQKEAVLGTVVQGKRLLAEEVDRENNSGSCSIAGVCKSGYVQVCTAAPLQQHWSGTVLGSLFSGLSNCSMNISSQNLVM